MMPEKMSSLRLFGLIVMPTWATVLSSAVITLVFIPGVWAMAASPYGEWDRKYHAKRDRLQPCSATSHGTEKSTTAIDIHFISD